MVESIFILAGQSNAAGLVRDVDLALRARYGAGDYRLIDVHSGGAPLTYSSLRADWASPGELRAELVAGTIAALAAAPGARIGGVIWVQGEADAFGVGDPAAYGAALQGLMGEIAAAVGSRFGARQTGIDTAPIALAELSLAAPASALRPNWHEIRDAQRDLALSDPRIVSVDPDALRLGGAAFVDDLHFGPLFRPLLAEALVSAITPQETAGLHLRQGGPGVDLFRPEAGAQVMSGGRGNDIYHVDDPGDRVVEAPDQGHDTIISSVSFALWRHGLHAETLRLTGTAPLVGSGGPGDERVFGNAGDNVLNGGRGDDRLFGGAGRDVLRDSAGSDRLTGGPGADVFVFAGDFGRDVITDFDPTLRGEVIDLTGVTSITGFADLRANHLSQTGQFARIDAGDGNVILLYGVSSAELAANDFLF